MSNQAHARVRIMKTLGKDAQPEHTEHTEHTDVTVILDASGSAASRLRGRYLEGSGPGIKIELGAALGPGMIVSIAGEIRTEAGHEPLLGKYRVCTCVLVGPGRHHVQFELYTPDANRAEPQRSPDREEDLNYYDVLQVSRNADIGTIHRVFHFLAQRFHPDNRATGDEDQFRRIVEAHTVLSDPEKRAAHDVHLAAEETGRLRIFDSLESTQGVQAEHRKRQGILRLLYGKRLSDPHNPVMTGRDFVEMLGCPAEHLEFSLWFLREQHLIRRSDSNRFEITWQGVEAFEASEAQHAKKPHLTLPAPAAMGA